MLDAASLNSGLLACHSEDCEDKKLQQSDLRVSLSLDFVVVVVVVFMNTEGPLVPFPMSYYPC